MDWGPFLRARFRDSTKNLQKPAKKMRDSAIIFRLPSLVLGVLLLLYR